MKKAAWPLLLFLALGLAPACGKKKRDPSSESAPPIGSAEAAKIPECVELFAKMRCSLEHDGASPAEVDQRVEKLRDSYNALGVVSHGAALAAACTKQREKQKAEFDAAGCADAK